MRILILATLFFLPAYVVRFRIGPFPTTLLEVLLLILFFVWGVKKIKNKSFMFHVSCFMWPILLFLLSGIVSVFIAPDLRAALGLFRAYILEPLLFFIIFLDVFGKKKDDIPKMLRPDQNTNAEIFPLLLTLAASAFVISLIALYQKIDPILIPNPYWAAEETRRVTSIYGFPNAVGLFLAPIVVLLVGWIVQEKKWSIVNCQLSIVAIASLFAIAFAKSEASLAALAGGLFFFGVAQKRFRRITLFATLFVLITILLVPSWRTYLGNEITLQNPSGQVRISQWKESFTMLSDRPLFGAGLSGYPATFAPYHTAKHIEIFQYPHNIILNFWSEMGVLGVVAFVWIVVVFFRAVWQKRQIPLAILYGAVMTTILLQGAVDVPYFKNDLALFFWFLVGLTFSVSPPIVKDNHPYGEVPKWS